MSDTPYRPAPDIHAGKTFRVIQYDYIVHDPGALENWLNREYDTGWEYVNCAVFMRRPGDFYAVVIYKRRAP